MVVQIGPHTVEVEGDCTLVRLHGTFTLAHMKTWCDLVDAVIAEHGHVFTISDFSGGGDFPADARLHVRHWPNVVYIRGTAIFGASIAATVVVLMMARVTRLVRKYSLPTTAVKTEREARAWIDELRKKLPSPRN